MDIQFQIRQNAMEMQEYMKDLFDWQKSIKKKERALVSSSPAAGTQPSAAPAPRGRASGAVAQAPADLMQPALGPKAPVAPPKAPSASSARQDASAGAAAGKKGAAAHTYTSYGKWDKFDVEAALASDDEEQAGTSKSTRRGAEASASASAGAGSKPSAAGPQLGAAAAAAAAAAASSRPATATPAPAGASTSVAPLSPRGHGSITITANDPAAEDLLKPVATTRLAKPAAADDGSTAALQGPTAAGEAAPEAAPAPAETLPPIRNSQPATVDAWRARGNDLFKAGEYDSAYECYSRSVEMQPTCLGHANRAMALLKLGRWQEAVDDCTAALRLDPSYVKAYQRRAAAHRQLGASLESARDWEAALRLEPDNRATAADRDAALAALLAEQKLQPPSRRAAVPVQWVLPPAVVQPAAEAEAAASAPLAAGADGADAAAATAGAGNVPAAAAGSDSPQPPAEVAASPSQPPAQRPQQQPGAAPAVAAAATTAAAVAAAAAATTAAAKGVPRTSVEFEAAWRGMAGDPRRQAAYLSAIPPASLPTVFKNSLTASVLASLVRCLLAGMAPSSASTTTTAAAAPAAPAAADAEAPAAPVVPPAQGVALLEGLTRVARFDLMAMSVPSRERQELRAAWEGLQEQLRGWAGEEGDAAATALASLRAKFRV
ncbi:hypothetical protein PLESTB_000121700 [Pleodorina starrii]|uniref:RNA-polymerase II-associated protein 3-like C-terminal domain-containing protein n=1 Tax=Pleodorina starrii TaxID=330485 RepID=A0A9W6BBK6_9CHLO|nr:hypothetical protein PLESTB_000121700 [Pleodorina starrii]GLC76340.1 hypothetical protein PLESTF_001769100 [Pleodorina starrii]